MKKICFLFIVAFCLILNVKALNDTESPILNSVSISGNSFYPGDNITITVDASDNLTGIETFDIEFRLKNNHSQYIAMFGDSPNGSVSFSYTNKIPENAIPGEYEAFAIQIWDGAGNLKNYHLGNTGEYNFNPIEFTILDDGKDYTPPVLHNVSVSNKVLNAPNTFTLTAEITDDKSSIKEVHYTYLINGELYNFYANKTGENTYVAQSYLNGDTAYSDALFISLRIIDEAGNMSKYAYDPSRDSSINYKEIVIDTNLDVTYSNKIIDKEAPVITKYYYSSKEVSAPGSVDITVDYDADKSGIANAEIYFQGYDKNNNMIDSWILSGNIDEKRKVITHRFTFDQYTPDSTFFVDKIVVTDKAGNKSIYTIYDDGNNNIEKIEMTLKEAIVGDVTTSTLNGNVVDVINKAEEKQTITIDTTTTNTISKDAFDSIKGTSKSIILVNDGIQWVFNGKDIINNTKEINTKINVYKINEYGYEDYDQFFDENTNAIVIEFANNGLLPGKALIKIKADYTLRDYIGLENLYVYHVESSEDGLESIAKKINMTEDGFYEFYITHNSKYIISKSTAKKEVIVKDSVEDLGNDEIVEEKNEVEEDVKTESNRKENDKQNFIQKYWIIMLFSFLIIVIVVFVIIFRKKIKLIFKKKKVK